MPHFQDSGSFCAYDPLNQRYWMLMPGPTVDARGTFDSQFNAPGSFDVLAPQVSFQDSMNQLLNQNQNEAILYLPAFALVNHNWQFPTSTDGNQQFMLAYSHAQPGAGSADASWLFYRGGQFVALQYDGGPGGNDIGAAADFGVNWAFDSTYLPGPGTYEIGGYVWWAPYSDPTFPGEVGFEQGSYEVHMPGDCEGAPRAGGFPSHGMAAPADTHDATSVSGATLRGKANTLARAVVRTAGPHFYVSRHNVARSGREFVVSGLISRYNRNPDAHIAKRGIIHCRAKIGIKVGPRNPHRVLPHYLKGRIARRTGTAGW